MAPRPLVDRFFEKVAFIPFHTCWEWIGVRNHGGYGYLLKQYSKKSGAHQISFELHYGPIPKGMLVLHRCDNPGCVNPAHLFLGTHKDNTLDMIKKNRHNPNKKHRCDSGHLKYFNGRRLVCRQCAKKASLKHHQKKINAGSDSPLPCRPPLPQGQRGSMSPSPVARP